MSSKIEMIFDDSCCTKMGNCSLSNAANDVKTPTLSEQLQDKTWNNTKPYVPHFTQGKIIKCYDGDTVTIATFINNEVYRFNIRMLGYDCAEIKSKDPQEKQVAKWAKEYITEMIHGKIVKIIKNDGYDKYGRLLLELEIDNINVNEVMQRMWGVSYNGGHKDTVDWSKWGTNGWVG